MQDQNMMQTGATGSAMPGDNTITYPVQEPPRKTLRNLIAQSIGQYVIAEFLIGLGNNLEAREGIVQDSGESYFILYDEFTNTSSSCDLYSLKFMTIYPRGTRPCTVRPSRVPQSCSGVRPLSMGGQMNQGMLPSGSPQMLTGGTIFQTTPYMGNSGVQMEPARTWMPVDSL